MPQRPKWITVKLTDVTVLRSWDSNRTMTIHTFIAALIWRDVESVYIKILMAKQAIEANILL